MKPVKLELMLDDKTLKGILSAEGNLDRLQKYTRSTIAMLTQELRAMQKELKASVDGGIKDDAKIAQIQALKGKIGELRASLKQLAEVQDEVAQKPIVQEDLAPKMRNLQTSMSQIARELPSLAMGPQMFFLAISNNIPMLEDAIRSAREEYARLMQTTGKATPVWRQVLSGIVSWQTALAVGVTLLVMYGDKIGVWVESMFKGKKAALSLADATEKVNESLQEESKTVAEQVTHIKSLADRWRALGGDVAKQKQFLKANREELDKTGFAINSAAEAETLLEKQTGKYIEAMALRAKATAAFNLAVEQEEKAVKAQIDKEQQINEGVSGWDKVKAFGLSVARSLGSGSYKEVTGEDVQNAQLEALDKEKSEAQALAETYRKLGNEATVASQKLIKELGLKETGSNKSAKAKDYATMLAEARIEADKHAEQTRLAIMKDGVEKRKAVAAKERNDELVRIDKEEKERMKMLVNARKNGQKVERGAEDEIKNSAATQRMLAEQLYLKELTTIEREYQQDAEQAWIEYNRKYGTAQEQRLAIAKDYGRRIAEAVHEGEKATLRAAMKEELQEVNMKELTDSIDFTDVFGRLDQMSTEALKALRAKLREYMQQMNGELSATDMKTLQDAMNRIERSINKKSPVTSLKDSYKGLVEAQKEVIEAQKLVATAQEKGEVIVQTYDHETGELKTEVLSLADAEERLNNAQNKRNKATNELAESTKAIADKMSEVSAAANSIVGSLESLGVEVSDDVAGVVEGFSQASEGAQEFAMAFASGNVFGMISGGVKALAGTVKTLGSLFGADWGGEKSRQKYEAAKEMYESYIAVLDKVIDKQMELVESMESTTFDNASNAYDKARELLKKEEELARQMGKEYLNSGASKGFLGIGSSSSQGVAQWESISDAGWSDLFAAMGKDAALKIWNSGRMTSLFDMSYEELVKLRDEATLFYSELDKETQEYIDKIIESGEAWEEAQKAWDEYLTQTPLDDFKNSYRDLLLDLSSDNADFAKDFEKKLQNALISSMFAETYQKELEELHKRWAEMRESGGELTPEEVEELRRMYNDITQRAVADREAMEKTYGFSNYSSQSGRAGGAINITEETAGRLEGIGNATLDHVATIDDTSLEIRDTMANAASSLAVIERNSEYLKRLEDIADNIQEMTFTGVKLKG